MQLRTLISLLTLFSTGLVLAAPNYDVDETCPPDLTVVCCPTGEFDQYCERLKDTCPIGDKVYCCEVTDDGFVLGCLGIGDGLVSGDKGEQ
ncbi:hypothetical protein Moror_10096 [Moniliophthora roreri MCA 2997]|uniref:Uncharacterized protein n=2 Tax=Moniliophthora roreri TaxID=221103 RepID=V2WV87_MONRO|nr:hypothetical protein Moror_10096 [Moniliophthora roreri MCA 2997]KAI3606139.1 hypothetical protein WG66_003924 [Moniliophthora roreri]